MTDGASVFLRGSATPPSRITRRSSSLKGSTPHTKTHLFTGKPHSDLSHDGNMLRVRGVCVGRAMFLFNFPQKSRISKKKKKTTVC